MSNGSTGDAELVKVGKAGNAGGIQSDARIVEHQADHPCGRGDMRRINAAVRSGNRNGSDCLRAEFRCRIKDENSIVGQGRQEGTFLFRLSEHMLQLRKIYNIAHLHCQGLLNSLNSSSGAAHYHEKEHEAAWGCSGKCSWPAPEHCPGGAGPRSPGGKRE
jgi:hypothetical protein